MADVVSFWLDNKMVSAHMLAEIGDQSLVDYRGKFYVITGGSAVMKGSKPLHYSRTSMPLIWKKALRGETVIMDTTDSEDATLPVASITKRVRATKEKEMPMAETASEKTIPPTTVAKTAARPAKKPEVKPVAQTSVVALCPYCNQKHDLAVEKGKNGKPFFVSCSKCSVEFAVRFVPATIYQAQVAGFK